MANRNIQKALLEAITEWTDDINRIVNFDCDEVNDKTEQQMFEIYKIIKE